MAETRYDVVGIGNAIVDVLAHADDAFIADHGLAKGAMTLIDAGTADSLYQAMGPGIECSGGSAANTIAALASLGGRGAFVGKVRDDQLGAIFAHDIRSLGVAFDTAPATDGAATARCLILVTPDAERTMNTYLGACTGLGPEDIDAETIAAARVTYMEGYLWDPPRAKQAFLKAASLAHQAGQLVSLTLSDSFCVERHRDEFLDLVRDHVDVLFANEDEIVALYRAATFEEAVERARGDCPVAAITRGEAGSLVVSPDAAHVIAAEAATPLDSTGAGDAYAAGFLYGFTHDHDLATCGRMGGIAAAEVIGHVGARPDTSLAELVQRTLA